MAFTVVPLHELPLPGGVDIEFGKFNLRSIPHWLLQDSALNGLSRSDRDALHLATHALVAEYEAESYGHPDPDWAGPQPRGIQELRWQSALLANMSIWMIMPSRVHVTCGFHALTHIAGRRLERPVTNHIDMEPRLFCHHRDFDNHPNVINLTKAAVLFKALSTVPRKNAMWAALRAFWAALTSYSGDLRYPLFWQGLESLFGSQKRTNGVSKRLRERISCLLADDDQTRQALNHQVRTAMRNAAP